MQANSAKVTDLKLVVNSHNKNSKYTAAILNEVNKQDEKLGQRFLNRFKANLITDKQHGINSIKPATHQTLNDLIREGALSIAEVKRLTHAAWKLVFKSIQKKSPGTAQSISGNVKSTTVSNRNARSSLISASIASAKGSEQIDVPTGFLWKPISDSPPHGLAILLPSDWTGEIEGIDILDPQSGDVLASGKDGGVGNGDRQHFRFSQQGDSFPDGVLVRVQFKDGSLRDISIGDTSARLE